MGTLNSFGCVGAPAQNCALILWWDKTPSTLLVFTRSYDDSSLLFASMNADTFDCYVQELGVHVRRQPDWQRLYVLWNYFMATFVTVTISQAQSKALAFGSITNHESRASLILADRFACCLVLLACLNVRYVLICTC